MKTSDFDYLLPERLIAQSPLPNRSDSRLMLLNRKTGEVGHDTFRNLTNYLSTGMVLVLNDTRVLPARLLGTKTNTGARIELLLLREIRPDVWETLARPARRVSPGTLIDFGDGRLQAECVVKKADGILECHFRYSGIFLEILNQCGEMPLPPYIHEKLPDQERYQTVYAREVGSAAAPTAGLHFTPELIQQIKDMGVEVLNLTLHVGLGTFRPVEVADIQKHAMHSESYHLGEYEAMRLNLAKAEKRPIIAIGTTSARTLEANVSKYGHFTSETAQTDIFIYPGYHFQAIDGLITNFHLPKSTLVMLVSAFCSREMVLDAYQEAIRKEYRFFSFGDSMFIHP